MAGIAADWATMTSGMDDPDLFRIPSRQLMRVPLRLPADSGTPRTRRRRRQRPEWTFQCTPRPIRGKARKTIVKDARPVCAHVYYCSQLRLAVFMSCVSCLSPALLWCPAEGSGQGASQGARRGGGRGGRRAPGGGRPGEAAARGGAREPASWPAAGKCARKKAAKRRCGCPYLNNSGR